jgi:hypothetical protein
MHWMTNQLDMAENDLIERLQALAQSSERRSKTARLRDVFDHVEGALRAGVARVDVLDELNRDGFGLTLASFKSALQRIRRERAGVAGHGVRTRSEPGGAASPIAVLNQNDSTSGTTIPTQAKLLSPAENSVLPEDWMTAQLTPAQTRLLTPAQRRARTQAKTDQYFPNRFKPAPVAETTARTPSIPSELQRPED